MSVIEAPFSALVSNVILAGLAAVILAAGIGAGWVARHPDRFRAFMNKLRRGKRVARIERLLRRWSDFLVRRFRSGGAYGLSFTAALVALCFGAWFFGGVIEDVLGHNETALIDLPAVSFIAAHRIGWLTTVMRSVTALGSWWFVTLLVLSTGILFRLRAHSWRPLLFLAVTVAGAGLIDLSLKLLVARPRPPIAWMLAPATGFAFPSGHTALSVVYGALAYLLARTRPTWRGKVSVWTVALIIVFLIGVSRVYLGVHWPTDVLGGWALAFLWLSAVLVTVALIEQPSDAAVRGASPPTKKREIEGKDVPTGRASTPGRPATPPDGLTEAQVEERRSAGLVNYVTRRGSRSLAGILKANIFTRFNALLGGAFVVILLLGGRQDALFGLIVIGNTAVGIIQELRAKWTLDRLTVLTAPRARVVRAGVLLELPVSEIVLDDMVELRPGDQVPVDGLVLAPKNLEVNEALLTGESEPVVKVVHDQVLSGSFVVSGSARVQAIRVGEESYARRLTRAASRFALSRSELRAGVNRILTYVGWIIIPAAALLLVTQLLYNEVGWRDAVVSSIGGLLGMIPQGLVLLTSLVMAAAVVRLGRRRALVQELAAVEMLARVDTLILDKTGTLTTGSMKCEGVIMAGEAEGGPGLTPLPADPRTALGAFARVEANPNPSLAAIIASCPQPNGAGWAVVDSVPFSSARKWSSVTFEKYGRWVLGAPEMVLKESPEARKLSDRASGLAKLGKRVLALSYGPGPLGADETGFVLPASLQPAALIVLVEEVRGDVAETIAYFKEQGVAVKIVSGDHPETIKAIADAAGIPDGLTPYDAQNLPSDPRQADQALARHNLFGRATPDQKRQIIKALQKRGHVVAMMGDGINDVLAIKESDFGIALGSGTAASRAVAQLILLSDDFSTLPGVIAEGRRVIANVERTANLFITKTVYVLALTLAVGAAEVPFPFLPRHMTLIDFFTIGTPAVFLSFARNTTRARSGFVSRVLRFALPAGATVAAATLLVYAVTRQLEPGEVGLARTAAALVLIGCGLLILALITRARTVWQWLFLTAWPVLFAVVFAIPQTRVFFALELPPLRVWAAIAAILIVCALALRAAAGDGASHASHADT